MRRGADFQVVHVQRPCIEREFLEGAGRCPRNVPGPAPAPEDLERVAMAQPGPADRVSTCSRWLTEDDVTNHASYYRHPHPAGPGQPAGAAVLRVPGPW